jgi:hypothetical protein
MQALGLKLAQFKTRIAQQESEDRAFQDLIQNVITAAFNGSSQKQHLKACTWDKRSIVLSAANKAFANELALRRDAIESGIKQEKTFASAHLVIK